METFVEANRVVIIEVYPPELYKYYAWCDEKRSSSFGKTNIKPAGFYAEYGSGSKPTSEEQLQKEFAIRGKEVWTKAKVRTFVDVGARDNVLYVTTFNTYEEAIAYAEKNAKEAMIKPIRF